MTAHGTNGANAAGPRRERIVLCRPSHIEHPETVDLAAAIEILNSLELDDEIWTVNNHDSDFQA